MSFRLCRWYDPYPRLAFAFELLALAPGYVREAVLDELLTFLEVRLPDPEALPLGLQTGNRPYDMSDRTTRVIEVVKQGSDQLKRISADKVLSSLARSA